MDSVLNAAGRSLAAGDPLGALKLVALLEDPPALALRGIAMAQLGELARARELIDRAARGFGTKEALARARCVVARSEVMLAARDLELDRALEPALRTLETRGDRANACHGRLLTIRRLALLGRVDAAATALDRIDLSGAPASLVAIAELTRAGLEIRRVRAQAAAAAIERAAAAATRAAIPALIEEIRTQADELRTPAARRLVGETATMLDLAQVEAMLHARDLVVVDACRRAVRAGPSVVSLARRPVLFAIARGLGEAWPGEVPRGQLIRLAFDGKRADDSHRARLRVEIGRLRRELDGLAEIEATPSGYRLVATAGRRVAVLVPPVDGDAAELGALLADGQSWSTAALALAVGKSTRTVQRALAALEEHGEVRSVGRGRARRWTTRPATGFTTTLLLPTALPVR